MENNNILFKIKDLEKTILRKMILDADRQCIPDDKKIPTPTQMQIIGYILDNIDKDVYQKDLETKLNLKRATISDVLLRMEKKGLIKRETDLIDTRAKKILLTNNSKELFEANKIRMKELERKATKDINAYELQIFSNVINKMIENISKAS